MAEETQQRTGLRPNGLDIEPRVERYREKTVNALHTGADTARVAARKTSRLGRRAGAGLDDAADYLEGYDVAQAPRDVGSWLKKHPGPILAAAAVAGFWFARSMRR